MKNSRLSSITSRKEIVKLLDGWLSCIMPEVHGDKYKGPEGAKKAIRDAMGILQSIKEAGPEFYETVNDEDLGDIITFLSDKNWHLGREE